jgi:hypothetical protein
MTRLNRGADQCCSRKDRPGWERQGRLRQASFNGSRVLSAIFLVLLAPVLGCVAYRYPSGPSPQERSALRTLNLPKLVVGVVEPEIHFQGQASDFGDSLAEVRARVEMDQACHLIESLRGTGLFGEVDFVKRLHAKPDLVVRAEPSPRSTYDGDALIPFAFSAGIFPVAGTDAEGVYFSRVDRPVEKFSFDWPVTGVWGFFGSVLLTFPGWHMQRDTDAFHAALAKYLVERRADLWNKDPQP